MTPPTCRHSSWPILPPEFQPFPKLARLSREMVITEKLDGTNAQVCVTEEGEIFAASRTRWITPQADNYGFARWVAGNATELLKLGPGRHFGEWWGAGIQRGYGLKEKRFSLFNVGRWFDKNRSYVSGKEELCPACCSVVPVLFNGAFTTGGIEAVLGDLAIHGSAAAPGFMHPEGIIIYHTAAKVMFKKTFGPEDVGGKGAE